MTGAGSGRGGRARGGAQPGRGRGRERGADRYEPARPEDPFDSAGWSSGASLEELRSVPLPVVPRRGPRLGLGLGLGGTLAVVAMAALLAAGFGVLGGRAGPSPSPPPGGLGPTAPRAPGVVPTPGVVIPLVTPFSPCGPPPTTIPDVLLQVDGRPTPGFVEILQWHIPTPSPDSPTSPRAYPGEVSIPVDVHTELWIVGGACANAWRVGLVGGDSLNEFFSPAEPEQDPPLASQNRFGMTLAPFGGRDLNLYADLYFPTLIARAIWRIHVERFERPVPSLQGEIGPGLIVEGCDVSLTLGNDYEYPTDPSCTDDMPFEPEGVLVVPRGELLQFRLGDWDVSNGVLTCGHLSGSSFIAEPEPGCYLGATGRSTPSQELTFPELPPDLAGAWTLEISACALSGGSLAANRICGAWYVNVEVGP